MAAYSGMVAILVFLLLLIIVSIAFPFISVVPFPIIFSCFGRFSLARPGHALTAWPARFVFDNKKKLERTLVQR